MTVSGTGSSLGADLCVGGSGTGICSITGGALAGSLLTYIGQRPRLGWDVDSFWQYVEVGGGNGGSICGLRRHRTLNIGDGGYVTNYYTLVGAKGGSAGTITFSGGTLSAESLMAAPSQLTGAGTIKTHGW